MIAKLSGIITCLMFIYVSDTHKTIISDTFYFVILAMSIKSELLKLNAPLIITVFVSQETFIIASCVVHS